MFTSALHRKLFWLENAALCVAIAFLLLHTLPRAWRTLNTDFPNYYTAARLASEGVDTSRMYEWTWFEREKDHRAVDIRVIGLLPITPFSTLAVWPLAKLVPLTAKHIWILFNLALLLPLVCLLHSMTGISYHRIALLLTLSFPLHRNLLYGQFYILLTFLIAAACWSYLKNYRVLAGSLVAITAAAKIFPVLLFVFFLRRKDTRASVAMITGGIATLALSIGVFGLSAHRTWLFEILPWVMHGEGLGTYATAASISGVLHCLFLSEPQWNPQPWHDSPLAYSLLAPTLQMFVLAPAILLIRREIKTKERVLLEWSALLTASLAISTIPASYNFVLMVFPVCALSSRLLKEKSYGWLVALLVAYLGIGYPLPVPNHVVPNLSIFLYVPRLPLMLAILFGIYALLWQEEGCKLHQAWTLDRSIWVVGMAAATIISVRSTLHLERGEREEYRYRMPVQEQGFLNASPQAAGKDIYYIAFTLDGYRLMPPALSGAVHSLDDALSFTSNAETTLEEVSSNTGSHIVDVSDPNQVIEQNAREPRLSKNGRDLAFIRDDNGRGQLVLRPQYRTSSEEKSLTASDTNVYEASFIAKDVYAYSTSKGQSLPVIVIVDAVHQSVATVLKDARYPAFSPDGALLAYSHIEHGVWNLWLRNQETGTLQRIADVPCNQVQPDWESDSKTLLYSTDCGRSLWFTALARRKVLP